MFGKFTVSEYFCFMSAVYAHLPIIYLYVPGVVSDVYVCRPTMYVVIFMPIFRQTVIGVILVHTRGKVIYTWLYVFYLPICSCYM